MSPWPIYIYFALIFLSRMAFRHSECVRATGSGQRGQPGLERWYGMTLCLLPLGFMQVVPFFEWWLAFKGIYGPQPAGEGFFALVSAEHYFSGLLLFMSGTWLATRSSRELASNWRQHRGELCSTGLYSIVRHPLYAGYLVQGAGCMLMLGARWSWIGYAAATGLIIARTFIEDRELAKRFPEDFQEYRKRVKRFIPSVF